ncbi:unnamed protein product [Paramecium pentaurelia]|uniref:Uncharacterized protein n=1 Tax=Paramecium pentaurelia TaxID=43138 RepID=A0A8S1VHR7_9CILI|nr:unnamed protein product [Paramecium pentaurelia]
MPVAESTCLTDDLIVLINYQAFSQFVLNHWKTIDDDPLEIDTKANKLLLNIRKKIVIRPQLPNVNDYLEKVFTL